MTLVQLQQKTGIGHGHLSELERDNYPNPGLLTIRKVADALRVSIDEILGRKDGYGLISLPIISKAVASPEGAYYTDQDFPPGAGEDYYQVDDPNAFVIRVEGTSMEPTIREGDLIVVTPEKTPGNGEIAIVRLAESGKTFLKRVEIRGNDVILKSDNQRFDTLVHKRKEIDWMYRVEAIVPR